MPAEAGRLYELVEVGIAGAAAAAGVVGAWALLERLYVAVPPNRALVLYGHRSVPVDRPATGAATRAHEPRVLVGGGTYLAPWNRASSSLSLAPLDVEASVRALRAVEGACAEGWHVVLRVQVKVPAEPAALRAAAENLLGLSEEELRAFVRRTAEGAAPAVLARLPSGETEPDWERLAGELEAALAPELVATGLVVRSVAVRELKRIAPAGRPERGNDPRRRAVPSAPERPARTEDGELRLARVERGLRSIAADLARLLRDEPPRSSAAPAAPWAGRAEARERTDRLYDSIADGRPPGPARTPYGAEPGAEASP